MVALAVLLTVVPSVMVAAVAVAIAAAVVEGVMVTGAATAVVVVVSVVLTWLQLSVDPLTLARFGRVSRPL
jgi:formaldehyde-activating enzyme involved in methanogenesis